MTEPGCPLCVAVRRDQSGPPLFSPRAVHVAELAGQAAALAHLILHRPTRRRWRHQDRALSDRARFVLLVHSCPARNLTGWPPPTINGQRQRHKLVCPCGWRTPLTRTLLEAHAHLRRHRIGFHDAS